MNFECLNHSHVQQQSLFCLNNYLSHLQDLWIHIVHFQDTCHDGFVLLSITPQVKYQDKDVIVREGAEANTFYIILKGEVTQRLF